MLIGVTESMMADGRSFMRRRLPRSHLLEAAVFSSRPGLSPGGC